uniref:Tudor domain-containing protein n=2 Tax=Eptatretus burgeri TaxID=7764 RepID=A0A8C4N7J3_EPTBU
MYVDYGNQEWLSLSQLRYLEPKFAELPRQAIATSLAYVCPTQEVVWTSRQVQWFIDRIQSCTMYAVLYCLQGTCFSVLHNAPKVDGYFRVQSNIASMMLMEGMASCSSFMKYSGSPWLLNSAYVHSGMTPKSPDQFSLPRVFMKHSNECQGIQQDNEDSLYPEGCVHTPLEDNKDFQANEASPSLAQTCLVENGVDGNMVGHTSRMGSVHVAQNSEISTSDAAQTQVVSSSTVVLHDSDNDKRREQVDNFNNSCQKSTRAKETSLEKTNSLEQTNGDNFVPPKLPEDDSCHRNGVTNIGLQSVDPLTEDARSEFLLMVKGGLKTRRFSENQEHSFYFTMSHIVTPSEFYIHLREEVVLFKLLQEELQHIYSSTSASLNFDGSTQDMPGSLCCVLHEESLTWCRGKIVGFKMDAIMDQDCFFVFLLDSGNSLWFTRNQLRVLLPTFHDVPGFAVKCCLHNIRAANANSHWNVWNHEAVHHFTKLTGFSTVFLGDVLFIKSVYHDHV